MRGQGRVGVFGTSATTGQAAVWGNHSAQGFGVVGDGAGATNAGVIGRNATGDGVRGEGRTGLRGTSTTGYGGVFQGSKAQLRLIPNAGAGRPTNGAHFKGELYLDGAAGLWLCTVSGTPGTWRKVNTIAN